MSGEIDGRFADRRSNTPKQTRQAQEARNEGHRLTRAQKALRLLADLHERGECPPILAGVKTKKAILELTRTHWEHRGGYYDAAIDTGRPALQTPEAKALWAIFEPRCAAAAAAEELRRKIDGLKFSNIPGYFPIPAPVIEQMFRLARLPETAIKILEPSAGSGAILDALKARFPLAKLSAYERHTTLQDILTRKGYDVVGSDFTEAKADTFDFILMNPPFERGQDMQHVQKAFAMLAAGGTLVSVMSPSPFYRSDKAAQAFRAWFEENDGQRIDLPAGSFKESGTQVGTLLVKLENRTCSDVAA